MSKPSKVTISWTRQAADDRSAIWHFYWENWGQERADRFNDKLERVLQRISSHPFATIHDHTQGTRIMPIDRASRIYLDHRGAAELVVLTLVHVAFAKVETAIDKEVAAIKERNASKIESWWRTKIY